MSDWGVVSEPAGGDAKKLRFANGTGRLITRGEILQLWKSDSSFCEAYSRFLATVPFDAYAWETPPSVSSSLTQPFECVLTSSAALARQEADATAFAQHIESSRGNNSVVTFSNLGGDADLVVPSDAVGGANYSHLAAFLRTAPNDQIRMLWAKVASVAEAWLTRGRPFWVSTAGLGVSWVHVRIDTRPKYYRHAAYKQSGS